MVANEPDDCTDGVHVLSTYDIDICFQNCPRVIYASPYIRVRRSLLTNLVAIAQFQPIRMRPISIDDWPFILVRHKLSSETSDGPHSKRTIIVGFHSVFGDPYIFSNHVKLKGLNRSFRHGST
jgi:hypothetical protein